MKAQKSIAITVPAETVEAIERIRLVDCKLFRFHQEAQTIFGAGERALEKGWEEVPSFSADEPFFSRLPDGFVRKPRQFTPYDQRGMMARQPPGIKGSLEEERERLLQILILGISRRAWELKIIAYARNSRRSEEAFFLSMDINRVDEWAAAKQQEESGAETPTEPMPWPAGELTETSPTLDDHAELIE